MSRKKREIGPFRRWTLRTKVVFHIVVLGGLSAGLLAAIYLTTQHSIIRAFGEQQAELAGALVENGIFLLKKCGRVQETQAEIHELVTTNEAIRRIRILTLDGRIFASTRPEEIGAKLPAAERLPLERMLAGGPSRRILPSGSVSLTSLSLIRNKPSCYSCHDSGRRVNGFLEVEFESSDVRAMVWKSQGKGIILALAALGVLIFIVLRLFERLINRPIVRLQDGMGLVRAGDLSVRWPVRNEDEIGQLTSSLNAMVGALQAAHAEIESLYRLRIERAEHLAAFGELAAGLAHEVKNPLSGMKGALEIIHRGTPDDDPRKDIFGELLVQVDKVIALIGDYLRYARIRPIRYRPYPPVLCAEDAVRLARTQVGSKSVTFRVESPPEDFRFVLDPDRIQEVLLNLLLNAVAALAERGTVTIRLSLATDGWLEIAVEDDGAGIPEDIRESIFQPFFSTHREGTGLGLSISRRTVEAHGGTIGVRSRQGGGTVFLIRLPPASPGGPHESEDDPDRR